jgi:hypothetical protein
MKRITCAFAAAVLGFSGSAMAQLVMQMGNGWEFQVAGNVNAFGVYTNGSIDAVGPLKSDGSRLGINGGLVPEEQVTRLRTGLLPAFITFDVKGKELNFDLGVHFGFAPQINSDGQHDVFGAQIDMRQVYLTVGGPWGQILAGRELGLYQRHNILTDLTLFGAGPTGGGVKAGGTTLGRIGFGYLYPNFNAQLTYTTPPSVPVQLAIGLFDPSIVVGDAHTFNFTKSPRVETELTYTLPLGATNGANTTKSSLLVWLGGTYQHANASVDNGPSVDGTGGALGAKLDIGGVSFVVSGYLASGLGTTLMFDGGTAVDAADNARTSWGYVAQVAYAIPNTNFSVGGAWGESRMVETDADKATVGGDPLVKSNGAATGSVTYTFTKSLRYVLEGTYARAVAFSGAKNHSFQGATGLMLFF